MDHHKLLIVEDDDAFVPLIKLALRDLNFEIDVAQNGHSALEQVSQTKYDLVISDYRLPEIHGLDILKAAKKHNNNCKIILISAANADMMDSNLEDLSLLGFIQKPLSPIELRNLVTQAF